MGELLCGNSTKLEQKVSNTEEIQFSYRILVWEVLRWKTVRDVGHNRDTTIRLISRELD